MECTVCSDERPHFLEPCPRCGNKTTFASHQQRGIAICNGCEEKFCTDCKFGSRYLCKYIEQLNGTDSMPPPPRIQRQITEYKWEIAEEHMRQHPEVTEYTIYTIYDNIYKILRRGGFLVRMHGTEACQRCEAVDIRYPEYRDVYEMRGFFCGKCLSTE